MSKSFLSGMKSISLFPKERNFIVSLPSHANEDAFKSDLEKVGADMRHAMKAVEPRVDPCKKSNETEKEIGQTTRS